jgi:hypothetical protein
VEITFGDGDRPRISATLCKLASKASLGAVAEPPDQIDVSRQLPAAVTRSCSIGTVEQMRAEWRGYQVVRRQPNELCPPAGVQMAPSATRTGSAIVSQRDSRMTLSVVSALCSTYSGPEWP